MKLFKTILISIGLIFAAAASGLVLAQHGGGSRGGGSHFGGSHSGGSHFGGSHFRGSHFGGSHFGGSHFRGSHHFHGHSRVGVFIGAPLVWPWYYPGPYYYPAAPYYYDYDYDYPAVIAPAAGPTVYVEQGPASTAPESSGNWWYYCAESRTYYPYVKQCPGGWQRVTPQPAPAQ